MERKTSLFSFFALANASGPQANQSTGLCACWSRYGLVSRASRLVFFVLGSFGGGLSAARPAGRLRQRASSAARPAKPRATMDRLTGSSLWWTWMFTCYSAISLTVERRRQVFSSQAWNVIDRPSGDVSPLARRTFALIVTVP